MHPGLAVGRGDGSGDRDDPLSHSTRRAPIPPLPSGAVPGQGEGMRISEETKPPSRWKSRLLAVAVYLVSAFALLFLVSLLPKGVGDTVGPLLILVTLFLVGRAILGFDDDLFATEGDTERTADSDSEKIQGAINDALAALLESHPEAMRLVEDEVKKALEDNQEAVEDRISSGALSEADVVRQFACTIAGNQLEEGRHHIYRGVLNGKGRMLLAFYCLCWKEEASRDLTTTAKANAEIAEIHKRVQTVG